MLNLVKCNFLYKVVFQKVKIKIRLFVLMEFIGTAYENKHLLLGVACFKYFILWIIKLKNVILSYF